MAALALSTRLDLPAGKTKHLSCCTFMELSPNEMSYRCEREEKARRSIGLTMASFHKTQHFHKQVGTAVNYQH